MKTYSLLKINPDLHHALKMKAAAEKTTLVALTQQAIENLLKNDKALLKLQYYLWCGGTLKMQNRMWWLFDSDGNGLCSGETLKDFLINFSSYGEQM